MFSIKFKMSVQLHVAESIEISKCTFQNPVQTGFFFLSKAVIDH
jgi:hypothetical protein